MRLGVRTGRGNHGSARRQAGHARAFALTAALAAVTFTAGCAGLGTSAAGGPGPATATAGSGSAAATAAAPATKRAPACPGTAAPTLARMPSSAPAADAHPARASSPSAPAASEPPPSEAACEPAGDRRLVTFVNDMSQTIWVAAAPNANTPLAATGWVLPAGQSVTITTPNNLNTRFWGRTGCTFSSGGVGHCQTGDCGGLFQCKGWGTIPATLAEVNFDAWDNLDFYDVSMVDGSNLPMFINITKFVGRHERQDQPERLRGRRLHQAG